ncbi:unnamed protein product, partial [Chrysoparadoxa australica]
MSSSPSPEATPAASPHGLQSLKHLVVGLKTIAVRNLFHKDWPSSSAVLPDCRLQLLSVPDNAVIFCQVCRQTVNPTCGVPESAWVNIPGTVDLEGCTEVTVEVTALPETAGKPIISETFSIRSLQPLPTPLVDIRMLPLNTVIFGLAEGEAFTAPHVWDQLVDQDALPARDISTTHEAGSVSLNSLSVNDVMGGGYDALELQQVSELRDEVHAREVETQKLLRQLDREMEHSWPGYEAAFEGHHREVVIDGLKAQLEQEKGLLEEEASMLALEQASCAEEIDGLARLVQALEKDQTAHHEEACMLAEGKSCLSEVEAMLVARQARLVSDLEKVYPIKHHERSGQDTIRSLEVPQDLHSLDDEVVSSALGYVAHLVLCLAKYMGVSLRYRVVHRASKSTIGDSVAGM